MIEHKGRWLICENVQAESWGEHANELSVKECGVSVPTREEAIDVALSLEKEDPTEYGMQINELAKDGAEVKIIE